MKLSMTMSSATAASVTYDAAKRMKRGLYSPNRRSKAARSSISPEEADSIPISPFSSRGGISPTAQVRAPGPGRSVASTPDRMRMLRPYVL